MSYHRPRYLIIFIAILLVAILFWTQPAVQDGFQNFVEYLKLFIDKHQYLGIFIFILLAAVSAILSPFSSIPFVPPAILIWGEAMTVIFLTLGWLLGAITAYAIGYFLGAPIVNYFVHKDKINYYRSKITPKAAFWLVFLFRLAFPSEMASYTLGIAQYKFRNYLAATIATEAIFAAIVVFASEAILDKNPMLLITLAVSSFLIMTAIGYMLHGFFGRKKIELKHPKKIMKKIIAAAITGTVITSFLFVTFANNKLFSDVPPDAWYINDLNYIVERDIMNGYPDGTFRPSNAVSRAELATIISRTIKHIRGEGLNLALPQDDPLAIFQTLSYYPNEVKLNVPFTSQAPYGDWSMPYQEACEEASIIMATYYLFGQNLSSDLANSEILSLVKYEEENGYKVDIDASQTQQIAENYYGLIGNVYYGEDVTVENIKKLLASGYPVIVPAAGQILANPNYGGFGPPYHMIVIIGYNDRGFITHDPGTQFGAEHLYSYDTMMNAIHDWNGSKSTVSTGQKAMIVLSK